MTGAAQEILAPDRRRDAARPRRPGGRRGLADGRGWTRRYFFTVFEAEVLATVVYPDFFSVTVTVSFLPLADVGTV